MPNSPQKYLVTIAGPTAVGKTALSIRLAKDLGTEIISADSRQFFRELSIGTAKPTPNELAQVPHHFVDSHSISEAYSAGDFERDALALLDGLFQQYNIVVMTGGSGFYVKAVLEGLDELPAPLPGLRESLTQKLAEKGLAVLQEEISRIDPAFAATQEAINPQRVLRALEVFHTSGQPISQFKVRNTASRPFAAINVALDRDRAELYQRIDQRMDMMLSDGLMEEAKSVMAFRDHHALKTVGYREVYSFLDGEYNKAEMVRLLKQNSRRYAKRQLTWFKHQGNFEWFHPDDYDRILAYVRGQLRDNQGI